MQKSLIAMLLVVSFSALFLSALFDNLQLHILSQPGFQPSEHKRNPPHREPVPILDFPDLFPIEPSQLVFTVSPAYPNLYWRIYTADFYTGFGWQITTTADIVDEFSETAASGKTQIFAVELNTTSRQVMLPVPPSETNVTSPTVTPSVPFRLTQDETADTYRVILGEPFQPFTGNVSVAYQASYHTEKIDTDLVSLAELPDNIRSVYLQLPTLPDEVVRLANDLRDDSLNPIDQILKDANFFLTDFEYDSSFKEGRSTRAIQQDWVASYLRWKKGICTDANTALAIVLRLQGIPARITVGFKPSKVVGEKAYYYSDHAHAETEAFLPPYGWLRFDVTPPTDDPHEAPHLAWGGYQDYLNTRAEGQLLLQITPENATGHPGERLVYRASLNNTSISKDIFKLETHSDRGWDVEVFAKNLEIEPFETGEALIEVELPAEADEYEHDSITVMATSTLQPDLWTSATATAAVGKIEKVSTSIQIIAPDTVTSGSYVQLAVSLSDNQGLPLEHQEIFVENYGLFLRTDRDGKASFSVDEASFWWRTFDLKVSFKGSNVYQPSSASSSFSVGPHALSFLIPLIFLSLVASAHVAQIRKHRKTLEIRPPVEQKENLYEQGLKFQAVMTKKSLLNITFPDIQKHFPIVWGVNDEIRIKCVLDGRANQIASKGNVEILADHNRISKHPVSRNRSLDISHVFKLKGVHTISAVLIDKTGKIRELSQKEVCIVNYKEEVVRLYNVFLQHLARDIIELKAAMTAREIERQILQIGGGFSPHNVREVIDCFEQAEYSDHPITRANYETIYLALKEMRIDDS